MNITINGSASVFRKNSVIEMTGNTGTLTGTGNELYIMTWMLNPPNQRWHGGMQEFILYTSDQSSNRTGIETNINDFYDIY